MDAEDRARLGQVWIETGLAEHASVAAFARFVLHLLSLAAPPDLVLDAIQAMKDEVHHARFCFGIARQLIDEPAAPGRMDLTGILDQGDDPASILQAAILEGCFEETVSAEYVRAAVERAKEESIRAALARIAADEARHADLAWRFVGWALQTYPELTPVAEESFARGLAKPVEPEDPNDWPLQELYGHLNTSSRRQVRETTLRDDIIPRIVGLLGRVPTANPPEVMS